MIFQLATPVQIRITAPMRMATTEVSPTLPGMVPRKKSIKEVPYCTPASVRALKPSPMKESGVAPVAPSIIVSLPRWIQVSEPDILEG